MPQEKIQYYQQRVDELQTRGVRTLFIQLKNRKEYLAHLCQRHYSRSPRERILHGRDYLQRLYKALISQINYRLTITRKKLEGSAGQLNSLSPLAILARGYAICRSLPSRQIVKDAQEVVKGHKVSVKLYQGELFCRVEETKLEGEKRDNDQAKI